VADYGIGRIRHPSDAVFRPRCAAVTGFLGQVVRFPRTTAGIERAEWKAADVRDDKTVLVVDDESPTREFLAWALREELGVRTLVAADADEVVRTAAGAGLDLVLLVLVRPLASGLAVARWLKSDPERRAIPVVALSAWPPSPGPGEPLCDEVIAAPCALEALVGRVRARLC
jgi:response regulator RpfG family c-di-GMP phosphodiesterase